MSSANELTVVPVTTRRQLRQFARFAEKLYRGNPYYVPEMESDVMDTMTPARNAAFEFCEAQAFLAMRNGNVVGRVAAIINRKANGIWNTKTVRFGWIDFIDDIQVSGALMDAVVEWGRARGMERVEGPFGFTDFDREGMLTFGFDRLATVITNYNYDYYPVHMERLGLVPTARWIEWYLPYNEVPDRVRRLSDAVLRRYELHTADMSQGLRRTVEKYGKQVFELVNEAYSPLYGYSAFSDRQIEEMLRRYSSLLDTRLMTIVLDKDENMVAVGIAYASLSRAMQKSRGRLFPFGWWHLLAAFKWNRSKIMDLMIIAVKPEYQNKGLNAILIRQVLDNAVEMRFEEGESNPELETNQKMINHWDLFSGPEIHKRRCAFAKNI